MGVMVLRAGETPILTGDITWAGCLIGVSAARASGGAANPAATERAARNFKDLDQFILTYSFFLDCSRTKTNEKGSYRHD
jgi:hypothetical protein